MAKMGDFFISLDEWHKAGSVEGFTHTFTPSDEDQKATADLSQIEADLEKLPEAKPQPPAYITTASSFEQANLTYESAKKYIASMYGVPPHLIEQPSPEVLALRKAFDLLEKKITEMQYGQSQTFIVPIWTPLTHMAAFDPDVPPAPTIKKLTVTIRLED